MPDILAQAIALHRDGRIAQAEPLYRRVLAAQPGQFDALHMLGVIAHQQGRHGEALDLIGSALKARPRSAWALSNYGVVLLELKRHGEAVASFERALAINPSDAETFNNLAATRCSAGSNTARRWHAMSEVLALAGFSNT